MEERAPCGEEFLDIRLALVACEHLFVLVQFVKFSRLVSRRHKGRRRRRSNVRVRTQASVTLVYALSSSPGTAAPGHCRGIRPGRRHLGSGSVSGEDGQVRPEAGDLQ